MEKKSLFFFFLIILFFSCKVEEPFIVEDMSITESKLKATLINFPENIQNKILSDNTNFLNSIKPLLKNSSDLFLFCDKQNYTFPQNYRAKDLVYLKDYKDFSINRNNLQISKVAIPSLLEMVKSAKKDNTNILISSAFRSYEYQYKIFYRDVKKDGFEEAKKWIAFPGTSQHQLGTSIDFGSIEPEYEFTKAGKWLLENASKFGWSLSFPKDEESLTGYSYECWHFRYITKEGCKLQKEYFSNYQYYFLKYMSENYYLLKASIMD